MNPQALPGWLIRLAVMLATPTMACFGYYAAEGLPESQSALVLPVMLSYPLALVGLIGVAACLLGGQRSGARLWLSGLSFVLPTAFVLFVRR